MFSEDTTAVCGAAELPLGEGTQIFFEGTYVSEGTVPAGSTWAMNPVPRNDTANTGASFKPRCEEIPDCGSTELNSRCLCSGMWGPYDLLIMDTVKVRETSKVGWLS